MTRVVVAGAIANKPVNPGEACVRTSWLQGLRRLGCETWFVEELSPSTWGRATGIGTAWFDVVTAAAGASDRSVLVDADTGGLLRGTDAAWEAVTNDVDLLVNVSGHARSERILAGARHRAYVDIDPAYTQIWHEQGADLGLDAHDRHFSVGLNLGRNLCSAPTAGFDWISVLPPVLLDQWPVTPTPAGDLRFTTIAGWRGFGTLTWDGRAYGPKAHQFRRFLALPQIVDATLELALAIHPDDDADRARLLDFGWRLVDPAAVTGTIGEYRAYIRGSSGELSVAQSAYVALGTGWFSDRTARYLAAGRPAIVQDTGIGAWLADGVGLHCFATVEEAAKAVRAVAADPATAAGAARAFAEQFLDAGVVLARFLEQALADRPVAAGSTRLQPNRSAGSRT